MSFVTIPLIALSAGLLGGQSAAALNDGVARLPGEPYFHDYSRISIADTTKQSWDTTVRFSKLIPSHPVC